MNGFTSGPSIMKKFPGSDKVFPHVSNGCGGHKKDVRIRDFTRYNQDGYLFHKECGCVDLLRSLYGKKKQEAIQERINCAMDGKLWCPMCKTYLPFESFSKKMGGWGFNFKYGRQDRCKKCAAMFDKALVEL